MRQRWELRGRGEHSLDENRVSRRTLVGVGGTELLVAELQAHGEPRIPKMAARSGLFRLKGA